MKRLLFPFFVVFAIFTFEVQVSHAQEFGPQFEVFEDSAKVVAIANLSEDDQFPVGGDSITTGMQAVLDANQEALTKLAKASEHMTIYGLQDQSGNMISGLGEDRAEKIAGFINGKLFLHNSLPLVEAEGLVLENDTKTRVLDFQQELLTQRSFAIVAHSKPELGYLQQKITELRNGMWDNFWLILGLAGILGLMLLWLLFGSRNRRQPAADDDDSQTVGSIDNSRSADDSEGDDQPHGTDDNAEAEMPGSVDRFFLIENSGDGDVYVDTS
jgi:hypothetical protein